MKIKYKNYSIWQKRTLFSYEASDEPIINKEANFVINFSFQLKIQW